MTPEQARELLVGTTPAPWEVEESLNGNWAVWVADGYVEGDIDEQDAILIAAAPELAQLVADMHYEYAVQVGMDVKCAYAFMTDTSRFRYGPLALADWWQTEGEAADLVAELKEINPRITACVVRRLVSEPEVVE